MVRDRNAFTRTSFLVKALKIAGSLLVFAAFVLLVVYSLVKLKRFNTEPNQLETTVLPEKYGLTFDFTAPIDQYELSLDQTPLILISGGRPATIHAESRTQVQEIVRDTNAVAAVVGGFFSMKWLNSNIMLGPVLSQNHGQFIPGKESDNLLIAERPLVIIGSQAVKFVPFAPHKHNTLTGITSELESATDAFVAAAWLVKDSQPQPAEAFGSLVDFDIARLRAFWGVNHAGQPTIGISKQPIDAVSLGTLLQQAGFRDAVMLDSGASTAIVYQGESLVDFPSRPVPHVVALLDSNSAP
jgi:hypothetical protein